MTVIARVVMRYCVNDAATAAAADSATADLIDAAGSATSVRRSLDGRSNAFSTLQEITDSLNNGTEDSR